MFDARPPTDIPNLITRKTWLIKINKVKALGECRPPYLRQIINPILHTVKMLSERLTPMVLDHYLHHDLIMLQLLW